SILNVTVETSLQLRVIALQNYRLIDTASIHLGVGGKATVFVGPNNSGKTSVAEAMRAFLAEGSKRTIGFDDFWAGTHAGFAAFEAAVAAGAPLPSLPVLRLDLTFSYTD